YLGLRGLRSGKPDPDSAGSDPECCHGNAGPVERVVAFLSQHSQCQPSLVSANQRGSGSPRGGTSCTWPAAAWWEPSGRTWFQEEPCPAPGGPSSRLQLCLTEKVPSCGWLRAEGPVLCLGSGRRTSPLLGPSST
ncbi:hypothetical protein JOQ06_000751, partial [Pogonophryne albipinna]